MLNQLALSESANPSLHGWSKSVCSKPEHDFFKITSFSTKLSPVKRLCLVGFCSALTPLHASWPLLRQRAIWWRRIVRRCLVDVLSLFVAL